MLTRRRFLTITALAAAAPGLARAAGPAHLWTGVALGARASIRLDHPDAAAIAARCAAEISRLEDIFSLYRADSALMRLNRDGRLDQPPFEMLECLGTAGAVHRASAGAFDPTIQPLWRLWADAAAAGTSPAPAEIARVRRLTGWGAVAPDAAAITLRPGMALTLNGIAQGYVADRVARLLEEAGLDRVLIDTGEIRALGPQPDGRDWPVVLQSGGTVALRSQAIASSAPLGTTFDASGQLGHILDPLTGAPAKPVWRSVSISAPSAALADALSTAACLMKDRAAVAAMAAAFDGVQVEAAVQA